MCITRLAIEISIMVICLFFSAFYSGSESAFVSLTPAQLEKLRKQGNIRAKLIYRLAQNTPFLLTTVLIGNNIMNIILTVIASNMTIRISGSAFLGVTTAILTLVILLLGEIYPKQLAIRSNERWALWAVYPVLISRYLFMPLAAIVQLLNHLVLRDREGSNQFTRDNLLQHIYAATGRGVVRRHTAHLLANTLAFEQETAEMAMTHRTEIVSMPITSKLADILDTISNSHFSRIPIYSEDREQITGIILLKDLLILQSNQVGNNSEQVIDQVMHTPLFVTQSMHLDRVFLKMRKAQQHMAIILDEYGGLAGLLTLEDLFERIYGQLYDEYDQIEREIAPYDDHSYAIAASVPLSQFSEQFSVTIPADRGMTTISGYLTRLYGDVPPAYAVISSPYGSFEILSASKRTIHKVLFRKKRTRK